MSLSGHTDNVRWARCGGAADFWRQRPRTCDLTPPATPAACRPWLTPPAPRRRAAQLDGEGRLLLTGSADHTLRLWDLGQQRCVQVGSAAAGAVAGGRLALDAHPLCSAPPKPPPTTADACGAHRQRVVPGRLPGLRHGLQRWPGRAHLQAHGCVWLGGEGGACDHAMPGRSGCTSPVPTHLRTCANALTGRGWQPGSASCSRRRSSRWRRWRWRATSDGCGPPPPGPACTSGRWMRPSRQPSAAAACCPPAHARRWVLLLQQQRLSRAACWWGRPRRLGHARLLRATVGGGGIVCGKKRVVGWQANGQPLRYPAPRPNAVTAPRRLTPSAAACLASGRHARRAAHPAGGGADRPAARADSGRGGGSGLLGPRLRCASRHTRAHTAAAGLRLKRPHATCARSRHACLRMPCRPRGARLGAHRAAGRGGGAVPAVPLRVGVVRTGGEAGLPGGHHGAAAVLWCRGVRSGGRVRWVLWRWGWPTGCFRLRSAAPSARPLCRR